MKHAQALRAARDAASLVSMNCACGGVSEIDMQYNRPGTDAVLRTRTRRRICIQCSREWKTVEIDASELQSLRLHTHLYLMGLSK